MSGNCGYHGARFYFLPPLPAFVVVVVGPLLPRQTRLGHSNMTINDYAGAIVPPHPPDPAVKGVHSALLVDDGAAAVVGGRCGCG